MLLRQGVWGKITIAMQCGTVEVMDFDPFQCSKVDLKHMLNVGQSSTHRLARLTLLLDEL